MARTANTNKIETLTLTTNVPATLANTFKDYCKAQPFSPSPSKVLAFLIEECLSAANVTIPAPVKATEAATAPASYATLVKAPEKKKAA